MATHRWGNRRVQRRGLPARLRAGVLRRDKGVCQIAGEGCTHKATQVDHIRPVAQGGTDAPDNLRAVCPVCHRAKSLQEATEGRRARAARAYMPTESHPGLM